MINVTPTDIQKLAPNARSVYTEALRNADTVLARYGINENALRLSHFFAQVLHETGGLTILVEDLNYSPERLVAVWPSRFASVSAAKPYAHNPEALANKVYGGRMGNTQAGDGWKFIGRGLLQITGRESYAQYGKALGINLAGKPTLAIDPEWALRIAAEEWVAKGCNSLADADSIQRVTKAINGGLIGLASRKVWLAKTKNVWP